MHRKLVVFAVIALFSLVNAQLRCGIGQGDVSCSTEIDPCCSDQGFCGRSAQHCGGGCQPKHSFHKADAENPSCLAYRKGGRQCISGRYDFSDSTWMIPADAYNGNPQVADFTVDRQGLEAGNLFFNSASNPTASGLNVAIRRPDGDAPGLGVRIGSTSYLPYGIFSASVQQSGVGGVVTSFISMGDEMDEIDWEWVGHKTRSAQSNYFTDQKEYGKGVEHNMTANTVTTAQVYTVDWSETRINWLINGEVVRTVRKDSDPNNYPMQPSRIQFGIWDGGAGSSGTRDWAGGYIKWDDPTFYSGINWIKIQCPGDPDPTTTPKRPAGYTKPSLKDAAILLSVVENTEEYVKGTVGTEAALPSPIVDANGKSAISPIADQSAPKSSGSEMASIVTFGVIGLSIVSAVFALLL